MFKFEEYSIKRESLNFIVEWTHKNRGKKQKGKKHNEYVTNIIGFFGSFKQAVRCISNEICLDPTNDASEIIKKLDIISAKLDKLDVKIVCGELSTKGLEEKYYEED